MSVVNSFFDNLIGTDTKYRFSQRSNIQKLEQSSKWNL